MTDDDGFPGTDHDDDGVPRLPPRPDGPPLPPSVPPRAPAPTPPSVAPPATGPTPPAPNGPRLPQRPSAAPHPAPPLGRAAPGNPATPPSPDPTAPTVPPPPPGTPPPTAPPPTAEIVHRPMSSARHGGPSPVWFLTAIGIATLAALPSLALIRTRGVSSGLGGFFGTMVLLAVVGALFSLKSRRAGLIAVAVVGVIALLANIGRVARNDETTRQISEALDGLELESDDDFVPTAAESECFAESGYDDTDLLTALTDMGDAGEQAQLDLFDAVAGCAPRALLTDSAVESYRQSFSLGLRGLIPSDEARCILERVVDEPTPSAVLSASDDAALDAVLDACLTDATWEMLGGAPGTGAQAIGDDPTLDEFAELCRGGEDVACDLLYSLSAAGSEYEDLSFDCAGRGLRSDEACVPGLTDDDDDGFFDADSPGWPPILEACAAGDMVACDFAFTTAELDSEPERIGLTCGERRALIVGGTCTEQYGLTAD